MNEREQIIAWLRRGCGWESTVNRRLLSDVADAIERGHHLGGNADAPNQEPSK